jgi:hypothetical protein
MNLLLDRLTPRRSHTLLRMTHIHSYPRNKMTIVGRLIVHDKHHLYLGVMCISLFVYHGPEELRMFLVEAHGPTNSLN